MRLGRDTERLPALSKQESTRSQELARQRRLLSEEEEKYKAEEASLNQEDGALKFFLDQVKSKRQHYAEIGVEQIAERIGKEGALKIHQQSLAHREDTLTSTNQNIKSKYEAPDTGGKKTAE